MQLSLIQGIIQLDPNYFMPALYTSLPVGKIWNTEISKWDASVDEKMVLKSLKSCVRWKTVITSVWLHALKKIGVMIYMIITMNQCYALFVFLSLYTLNIFQGLFKVTVAIFSWICQINYNWKRLYICRLFSSRFLSIAIIQSTTRLRR